MNFLAKIFVVVNLVLSIIFLGVAATLLSQKWDYKMKFETTKRKSAEEKTSIEAQNKNLQGQIDQFKKDIKVKDSLIREAENRASDNDLQLREQKRINTDLGTKVSELNDSYRGIARDIKEKDRRIAELETQRDNEKHKAEQALREKEIAQDQQQRLEIQVNNALGQASEKDKTIAAQQKELWEAKQIIRSVTEAGVKIPLIVGSGAKANPLDGAIQAVSASTPLVIINLGSDEGVTKGYEFTVYRGGEYIGRVIVDEVYKDACAARIMSDLTPKKIEKGDKVTTRIGGGGR